MKLPESLGQNVWLSFIADLFHFPPSLHKLSVYKRNTSTAVSASVALHSAVFQAPLLCAGILVKAPAA